MAPPWPTGIERIIPRRVDRRCDIEVAAKLGGSLRGTIRFLDALWVVEGVVPIGSTTKRDVGASESAEERFEALCNEIEPGLRRALTAAFGSQAGRDATASALAWAWEHFDRIETMANPGGYLYRVGQTTARKELKNRTWSLPEAMTAPERRFEIEPELIGALSRLSARQRSAVLLVHGHGFTLAEASELMGCRIRTLRNHLDRGLKKLRADLGVETDEN